MQKIFNAAKTALTTIEGKPIKTVALFKDQFRKLEEGKQIPFTCPAVFIQFLNVTYQTNADKAETGTRIVRVYIAENNLARKDDDFFTLRNTVHKALQGLRDNEHFSRLNRVAETPDPEFNNLTVWTMDYDTSFNDDSARPVGVLHTLPKLTLAKF